MRARVWLMTDRHVAGGVDDLLARTGAALAAVTPGALGVIVRDKDLPAAARARLGEAVVRRAREHGAYVLVAGDDAVVLARQLGADGVHLPDGADLAAARASLPTGAHVGGACHAAAHAAAALAAGADHVTLSPIWATSSKPGAAPLGEAALGEASGVRGGLLLALGGVDGAVRARAARAAGADGVAVIRAILAAPDPAAAALALCAACEPAP